MNPLVAESVPVSATTRIGAVLFASEGPLAEPTDADQQVAHPQQLARARRAGLMVGVVATPRTSGRSVDVVQSMTRLDDSLGPFDVVATCFHALTGERKCSCTGLNPGTVRAAAAALRLPPSRCLVVGAVPSDVAAADEAGAVGVVMSVAQAIDMAVESVVAPDRALERSLEMLEVAWKAS